MRLFRQALIFFVLATALFLVAGCTQDRAQTEPLQLNQSDAKLATEADTQQETRRVESSVSEAYSMAGFETMLRPEVLNEATSVWVDLADASSPDQPRSIVLDLAGQRSLEAVKWPASLSRSADQWRTEMTTGRGEYEIVVVDGREYLAFAAVEPAIYLGDDGLWHHEEGIIRDFGAAYCFDEANQVTYSLFDSRGDAEPLALARDLAGSFSR